MTPLLSVQDLNAFYGQSHVLRGVTLHVNPGEVVSLIGRNGAGKTTTLKSVMGVLRSRTGQITFGGHDISRLPSNRVAAQGLAWVPEERAILSTLTVRENLELPPSRPGGWSTERIYDAFPVLRERGHHPGSCWCRCRPPRRSGRRARCWAWSAATRRVCSTGRSQRRQTRPESRRSGTPGRRDAARTGRAGRAACADAGGAACWADAAASYSWHGAAYAA